MTNEQIKNYITFMHTATNIMNCENCPENSGFSNWQNRKPCGQQNCWVEVHLRETTSEE